MSDRHPREREGERRSSYEDRSGRHEQQQEPQQQPPPAAKASSRYGGGPPAPGGRGSSSRYGGSGARAPPAAAASYGYGQDPAIAAAAAAASRGSWQQAGYGQAAHQPQHGGERTTASSYAPAHTQQQQQVYQQPHQHQQLHPQQQQLYAPAGGSRSEYSRAGGSGGYTGGGQQQQQQRQQQPYQQQQQQPYQHQHQHQPPQQSYQQQPFQQQKYDRGASSAGRREDRSGGGSSHASAQHGGGGGRREVGGYGPAHGGAGRPYNVADSRTQSFGAQMASVADGRQQMLNMLAPPQQQVQAQQPGGPNQQASLLPAPRPGHGSAGARVELLANLYRLQLAAGRDGDRPLLHYHVTFSRISWRDRAAAAGGGGGGDREATRAAEPAGAAGGEDEPGGGRRGEPRKPPMHTRDILAAVDAAFWRGRLAYAFDGTANLLAPALPDELARKPWAPPQHEHDSPTVLAVHDVPTPGKHRTASWQVSFRLGRAPVRLGVLSRLPRLLAAALAEGDADVLEGLVRQHDERRQLLGWAVKQALLSAASNIEVGRCLYTRAGGALRNIGGGLAVLGGLRLGVRLTDAGLMLVSDVAASAFLRTDISLVQWMAELGGYYGPPERQQGGPGGGRRLPPVGLPDVSRLMADVARNGGRLPDQLWAKVDAAVRGKKVVYHCPSGKQFTCVAMGLSRAPAAGATFQLSHKADPDASRTVSVAAFFQERFGSPLAFPQLPVVEMKPWRRATQMWLPPEHCTFAPDQRTTAVTHRGGLEQMLAAACKEPSDLAHAVDAGLAPATSGKGQALLGAFGVSLARGMTRLEGRLLPGPWLVYRDAAGAEGALGTGSSGAWNLRDGARQARGQAAVPAAFSEPAQLRSWGAVAALDRRQAYGPAGVGPWLRDLVLRMSDLGMLLGRQRLAPPEEEALASALHRDIVWLDERRATHQDVQRALQQAMQRAQERTSERCQLVLCFIRDKPSPLYAMIKAVAELAAMPGLAGAPLGIVTQVVVASKAGLTGARGGAGKRSQYCANLAMKINVKCGGVNTRWAAAPAELLAHYLQQPAAAQVMVFGVDLNHPGRASGKRSKAAVVGSLDRGCARYAHSCWVEEMAGSESLTPAKLSSGVQALLLAHYAANGGRRPDVLVVYRDGVSEGEMMVVRRAELEAILAACGGLPAASGAGGYRPRIVYVMAQKRHHVRLLAARRDGGAANLEPGTVVDRGIVSPHLYDFYLNSHKPLIGTCRCVHYTCLLDELGLGADALQLFTHWLCFIYCRATRSVSVCAPIYYAHLLAYRSHVWEEEVGEPQGQPAPGDVPPPGEAAAPHFWHTQQAALYAPQLAGSMFYV